MGAPALCHQPTADVKAPGRGGGQGALHGALQGACAAARLCARALVLGMALALLPAEGVSTSARCSLPTGVYGAGQQEPQARSHLGAVRHLPGADRPAGGHC